MLDFNHLHLTGSYFGLLVPEVLSVHQQNRNKAEEIEQGPQNELTFKSDKLRMHNLAIVTLKIQEKSTQCVTHNKDPEKQVY